ncbi:MAG: hypothetical protein KDD01_01225 [Phaeodactylibacter sp.]|nr:hypothetical protein [Phaeodactylibacter sp.]
MKTNSIAFLFSTGLILLALLLAFTLTAEDPLEARYQACILHACNAYTYVDNEAEALKTFDELRLASEKLGRCRCLKAQLYRISTGPVAGLATEPGHCRQAHEKLRREVTRLLDTFEAQYILKKTQL